jgi:CheY-like chemotaxis protein/HPt (histidine-containing phosphotransfer) domain-containing protein
LPEELVIPRITSVLLGVMAMSSAKGSLQQDGQSPPGSLSILLVEDTASNRKILASLLNKRGHRVTGVPGGAESLAQFVAGRFDVILMDIEMPGMDGYQAAAAIRRMEEGSGGHTPIIALTAHAAEEERQMCVAAGMDARVAKPIDVSKLIALLESVGQVAAPRCHCSHGPAQAAAAEGCGKERPPEDEEAAADVAATIERLGGDLELLQNFIEVFDEDSPQLLQSICAAAALGDWGALRRSAHALRGLAANFDARILAELAHRLERVGIDEPLESAAALPPALSREVGRVRDALSRHRQAR